MPARDWKVEYDDGSVVRKSVTRRRPPRPDKAGRLRIESDGLRVSLPLVVQQRPSLDEETYNIDGIDTVVDVARSGDLIYYIVSDKLVIKAENPGQTFEEAYYGDITG